jgi:DivIVA domain-containing protein
MSEHDDEARRGDLATNSSLLPIVRTVLLVLLAYAVVGAVAGAVWEWVWTPPGQVVQQHQVFYDSYASLRRAFTGTGWYAVVGTLASAVVSLGVCLLTRRRGLLALGLVIVGSAIAAAVMLKVGTSLGPADPTNNAAHTVKRTPVPGELTVEGTSHLGIKTPYLVWPMASLAVLALVFFALPVSPTDVDRPEGHRRGTPPVPPSTTTGVDATSPVGIGAVPRRDSEAQSPDRDRLVDEIRSTRFKSVRIRRGYDMGSVDRLLDYAADALGRGERVAPLLEGRHLPTVSFREAYDIADVDAFLESLEKSALTMDAHG